MFGTRPLRVSKAGSGFQYTLQVLLMHFKAFRFFVGMQFYAVNPSAVSCADP